MSIKGVMKNLKKKGIRGTLELRRERLEEQREKELLQHYQETLVWDESIYRDRPFRDFDPLEYKVYMSVLAEREEEVRNSDPKRLKDAMKEMKAIYLKDRAPEIYARSSGRPIEDKVILMENGNSPSPSSFHVGKRLEKDGKYEVHYTGLKLRQVSMIEYYENALRYVEDLATAKAVFLSTANDVLSQFDVRPETKVIQLWHGVGVFKKVGYSTMDNPNFGLSRSDREEYNQYRNYSYVTIPDMEQAWIFEDAMHIPVDSGVIVPVGVSRTDVFYDEKYIAAGLSRFHKKYPHTEGKKIILYAPTFRGAVSNGQAPDRLDVDMLGEALSDEYVLLIKHHSLGKNRPPIPERWNNTFAFDMNTIKGFSIERLLTMADICITDYSSIAFEYAITERPLIFFAYDLEDYIDKRGMYYDYEDITPGPVCRTNEEMIDYITHIEERFDPEEIKAFKQKYVSMCDGHATDRTIALLDS